MNGFPIITTSSVLFTAAIAGVFLSANVTDTLAAPDGGSGETLVLTGVVRDFIECTKSGGHPDFEVTPSGGFGIFNGNISPTLGADGKPVFAGGGWLTKTQWKDSKGHGICYKLYDASLGDTKGIKGSTSNGGIQSASSFNKWFNDVPGTNLSMPLSITLQKEVMENGKVKYIFDDKTDPVYSSLGGFFPIDGSLYGLSGGSPAHNFHFTFELHTMFTYDASAGQTFKFIGDDDVFVFINGKMVIDLGGVHSAKEQFVQLDRLGLTDGTDYPLDFFFAERHRTQSNCRIETNLGLNSSQTPSVSAAFD